MIRVVLPTHLRDLAGIRGEVTLSLEVPATPALVLDAVEARFPALLGTVREEATGRRRPFVRYYACGEDVSHEPPDAPLPEEVQTGREPFIVLGAISGG